MKSLIHHPEYNEVVNEIDTNKKLIYKTLGYHLPSTMEIFT
jgi:hypothetical protein